MDISVKRGDQRVLRHQLYQPRTDPTQPKVPFHLGGSTLRFVVADEDGTVVIDKSTGAGIEHQAEPFHLALTTIDPADTNALAAPQMFRWELQLTPPAGGPETVDGGRFYLMRDYAR